VSEQSLYKVLHKVLNLPAVNYTNQTEQANRMSTTDKNLDWPLALQRANNNESLARELLGMLLNELPEQVLILKQAAQSNDIEALKSITHKIHGACCYCGVPQLHSCVSKLETALKSEQNQWQDYLQRVFNACDRLLNDKDVHAHAQTSHQI